MATIMKGWALSCQGQVEEGIAEMRGGIKAAESTGVVIPTWCLFPLAEEYLRAGRSSEAGELVDQMLELVRSTGNREDEADVYRLKGELSMMQAAPDKVAAEKWFRAAIEVARRQSAKLYELRATISLARLLRDTAAATKRARCSPKSTTGSPKASTPPTSRMRKRCSTNYCKQVGNPQTGPIGP